MSDWNDKSDFEVNKRLTELLGMKIISRPMNQSMNDLFDDAEEDDVFGCIGDLCWKFNYCNYWSDIGPLIESYQIDVGFIDGFGWTACQKGQQEESVYNNPKRAAAICIIQLLESQQ